MTLWVDTLLVDVPADQSLWHLPALTDLGNRHLAPARLLAELERQQPKVVLMSAQQLEQLLGFAALPLSDLGFLEQLLFVTQAPGHSSLEQQAAATLGCSVRGYTRASGEWQMLQQANSGYQRSLERALGHPDISAAALHGAVLFVVPTACLPGPVDDYLEATAAALDGQFEHDQLAQAVRLSDQLGNAALLSMLNGLDRCGLIPVPLDDLTASLDRAGIAPEHRPLIARWLDVLQREGLLYRTGTWLQPTPERSRWQDEALEQTWARLAQTWADNTGGRVTLEYARDNARQLPALMRGESKAVHLLFPEGRTERAAALYRESLAAQYQHRAVAHWIGAWAARNAHGQPLRILEVGAGTGATTEALLPALGSAKVDYLCTDVSRYFSEQAAARLTDWPWVRHGVFDIDRALLEQGYVSQSWDLIVAGGVLNAARDTEQTLSTLHALLKPGGWLVFSEPTREEFWVMASQAFMLNTASDERQHSSATFLNFAQWQAALHRAGFHGNRSLPHADHPLSVLGHRVFVAQVPQQRLSREALADHLQAPDLTIELPEYLPDTATLARWAQSHTAKDSL
ncbi:class I SAM-dependent methyltransferase [Pseudomonas helleri]|uniref:Methyltransferase n=1 Tax=Pseudomonas helleri TaxID=1608996 RepID=A0A6L5I2Q7_9PSED|nr:class I SAM-dependent methyltransferase [Pseudomonas helleri]MQU09487.1 methyltransferase [Pseudomonas helleri]